MDNTPIYQYAKPTSASLEATKIFRAYHNTWLWATPVFKTDSGSILLERRQRKHILTPIGVRNTCACLCIAGMSDKTLRWKLFPFSLMGRAKQWYGRTVGSMQGDWGTLCSKFCLCFFPISRVVSLWINVLTFRGDFLHLSTSEAWSMLDRISGKTPCTSIHNELP
jgi:hypothetical protein